MRHNGVTRQNKRDHLCLICDSLKMRERCLILGELSVRHGRQITGVWYARELVIQLTVLCVLNFYKKKSLTDFMYFQLSRTINYDLI